MKNVMLTIRGTQDCDGEINKTAFSGVATLEKRDGDLIFTYDDGESMGLGSIETTLTVTDDGMVIMQRGNGKYGNIVVEHGKRHICRYNTEYGALTIGISGDSVVNRLRDGLGTLSMSYSIDVESGLLSKNYVEVIIEEDV